jgi:flavorubredoxin
MEKTFEKNPPDWYSPGGEVHTMQNAYMILGDEKTLLFDTLDPVGREQIITEIENILDGRPLDYLAVSHPEAPHAGNAFAILEENPGATLVAPGHGVQHDLYHLDNAKKAYHGDLVDLGNRTIEFLEPSFLDHGLHIWMREQSTDTLFPVDWLGHFVMGHEKLMLTSEIEKEITHNRLLQFHGNVFQWYQYVNTDKTDIAIENIIEEYNPSTLAPSHGLVINKKPNAIMRKLKTVIQHIKAEGRLKTL